MKLTKDSKPIRINRGTLKPRWIIFLDQGSSKDNRSAFYKILKVSFFSAVCIPVRVSNRIEAATVEEEYEIAIHRSGYAASLHHICAVSEVAIYGILLRDGEKKVD